jgi:hypothetical protein
MEIILRPSIIYPIGLTIVFLLILIQVSKDWSNGKWARNSSMIVVTGVFLMLIFISIKKTTIDINESGLKISGAFTATFYNSISWNDINSITFLKNYKNTEFEPTLRQWGSGIPGYCVGKFQLANKKTANCLQKGFEADAIVIDTQKGLYLLSFENIADVYDEIITHTTN